jgi:ribonuclease T1
MTPAVLSRSVLVAILLIAGFIAGGCRDPAGAAPVLQEQWVSDLAAASSADRSVRSDPADRAERADLGAGHAADPGRDQRVEGVPAKAYEVLATIQQNGGKPPPGYVGGRTFMNRERRLPSGRYREYDIHPPVPGKNRGAERIVVDQRSGKAYYTGDHYRTFIPMN